MRIAIIALSAFSIGELHNAICVARQLVQRGAEVLFLTPYNHLDYVRAAGLQAQPLKKTRQQNSVLYDLIATFHPDGLLLADFHNLDQEPELIDSEALASLSIPCATFDSMSFGPEKRVLLNHIIRPEDEKKFRGKYKRQNTLRAMPDFMTVFRTCPLNAPNASDTQQHSIKLYTAPFVMTQEKRREVRRSLGINSDEERLVMFARASWAAIAIRLRLAQARGSFTPVTYSYETFLQELLIRYLSQVDRAVKVVGVTANVQSTIALRSYQNIQFLNLPFLGIDEYADLLFACDLFITDNITSCSMAKAVFGHVPVLSLINTRLTGTNDGSPLAFSENDVSAPDVMDLLQNWNRILPGGIYPFYVYPNGWIDELAPLLQDNPYFDVVPRAEMFAVAETAATFAGLLCDKAQIERLQNRQEEYIQSIMSLPDTYDIVSEWLTSQQKASVPMEARTVSKI